MRTIEQTDRKYSSLESVGTAQVYVAALRRLEVPDAVGPVIEGLARRIDAAVQSQSAGMVSFGIDDGEFATLHRALVDWVCDLDRGDADALGFRPNAVRAAENALRPMAEYVAERMAKAA
ncbi:hypothetical protein CKO28_18870 [Rhodovibrio sodomensis]|uniref:Uncharacterized protein n=1 Tax=Rhodovibrio sodomensis TaxID=1088 RepID=A0ABS1DJK6_9PROT|nr:hypothetical protein [Rhodovibrio sodomensis]MBK1670102.1 hypothetical protein [Rhodovibrio sodomensis]